MNKNSMKVAFAALCLTGIQFFTSSGFLNAETITFTPIVLDPPYDDNPNPHRAPQQNLLPCVDINDTCDELTFTSDCTITLAVEIRDEQGTIVHSQELFLTPNASEIISISNLTSGEYTIYLTIEEQIYEGVFMK